MKLTEEAFRPEILPALQALHSKLQSAEINFEDGKNALVSHINRWTEVPGVKRDLITDIKFHVRDNDALIAEVERILMVFGGTPALSAVAETSDEDSDMDKEMQELKAGSKYMGICPICKRPITGKLVTKDKTTGKETTDKEADKVEYWHGKKAHAECVAAEKEKEGKKEPEPVAATEDMTYDEIDAKIEKLGEEDTSVPDTKALHDKMVQDAKDQFGDETDEFDIESAIYWLASDYHSGQSSPLYSILSMSKFKPGPSHREVKDEGEMAEMIYDYLKNEYVDVKGRFVYEEFSRQHYELIANVIKTARDKDEIAAALADLFAKDNKRFDRERFLKAAGIEVD